MRLPTFIRRWFIQPPADIVKAFNEVNGSMTYVYYKSALLSPYLLSFQKKRKPTGPTVFKNGYVYILDERRPPDLKAGYGNCVTFSIAYEKALSRGTLELIKLWNGDWHCVLDVKDGDNTWRLDCRKRMVELV